MKRAVILNGNARISDYHRKSAVELLAETGGNTGNLAFRFAVVTHLTNHVILPWDSPVKMIRDAGDVVVLPLANQLGAHTNLGEQGEKLLEIGLPVVGIGLGAQAPRFGEKLQLNPGTLSWLAALVSLSPSKHPNIGVRGEYTAQQIAELGFPDAATVIGCPSNFINMTDDISGMVSRGFERPFDRVAVAAGIPYIPDLTKIEQSLAALVTKTSGAYIVQHDLEMLQLARREFSLMEPEVLDLCRRYIGPSQTTTEFKDWISSHAYAFFDIEAWMDFLRRFDFVIGTRFHGVMLAIQAGVPAACIAHDSRTLEMCSTMGVPVKFYSDLQGDRFDRDSLRDFSWDAAVYENTRSQLKCRYQMLLTSAGLTISSALN